MKTIRFFATAFGLLVTLGALAQSTMPALNAYYGVKNALVATQPAKARSQAVGLVAALGRVDATNLAADDKKALTVAQTSATTISKTADVAAQRSAFKTLSTSMITLIKATKPTKTYVQYCPMVKASWLSDSKEIRNPYYGDEMLTCGKTSDMIE